MGTEIINFKIGIYYSFCQYGSFKHQDKPRLPFSVNQSVEVIDFSLRRQKLRKAIENTKCDFVLITPSLNHLCDNIAALDIIFEKIISELSGAIYLVDSDELIRGESLVSINLLLASLSKLRRDLKSQKIKRSRALSQGKMLIGRPVILTSEIRNKVLSLFEQGVSCRRISRMIGTISKSTVHRFLRSQKDGRFTL